MYFLQKPYETLSILTIKYYHTYDELLNRDNNLSQTNSKYVQNDTSIIILLLLPCMEFCSDVVFYTY